MPLDLSIIIPAYNEAKNLPSLIQKIQSSLDPGGIDYEVIFVDDGSRDDTVERIREFNQRLPRFKGIQLKRNFGKSEAYMAGFEAAAGKLVATMDGDLQDDPADLLKLIEEIKNGADLAIGWKTGGKSSKTTFFISRFMNTGIRLLIKSKVHDLNCPLRVMTNDVAKNLHIYASLHRYIPIMVVSQGYTVTETPVANYERLHGTSNYSYWKYLESLLDLMTVLFVTNYQKRPLQFLGPIGLFSMFTGFSIDLFYFVLGISGIEHMKHNIPSLLLGVALMMIGLQIILTGLVGEIISRELRTGKKQSHKSVKAVIGLEGPCSLESLRFGADSRPEQLDDAS